MYAGWKPLAEALLAHLPKPQTPTQRTRKRWTTQIAANHVKEMCGRLNSGHCVLYAVCGHHADTSNSVQRGMPKRLRSKVRFGVGGWVRGVGGAGNKGLSRVGARTVNRVVLQAFSLRVWRCKRGSKTHHADDSAHILDNKR